MFSKIFQKLGFAAAYGLLWILLFQAGRIAFFAYNRDLSPGTPFSSLFLSMVHGLRMDMSMAAYLLLPVSMLMAGSFFLPVLRNKRIYSVYSALLLLPVVIIMVCDLPAFAAWGYRLDVTPLRYLSTPGEAMASVSHLPVWLFLIVILGAYLLFVFLFSKLCSRLPSDFDSNRFAEAGILLLFTASLLIPMRGGFQLAPLNQSSVYFGSDNFANQAALNVPWNFMRSVTFLSENEKNPFEYLDAAEAEAIRKDLFLNHGDNIRLIDSGVTRPNVIIIVWESLTSKLLGLKEKNIPVTPGLEKMIAEGVYFSHVYASGDRTDKGIVSVLSGYPAQPTTSIVKEPRKAGKLKALPSLFANAGYQTRFYYGGETEFANMKAYLLGAGFRNLTDVNAFADKDRNSKWGAHDHVVADTIKNYLSQAAEPFFINWLTLTSHEPFEIPGPAAIPGNSDREKFLNSMHYSDSVISALVSFCKQQAWWRNTVMIIIADHGHRLPAGQKKEEDFRIPMLWLGGALNQKGKEINSIISQSDLAATLCGQFQWDEKSFPWSRNILREGQRQWAYFCFNNGFGFLEPGKHLVYDNTGRRIMEEEGNPDRRMMREGMAMQQMSFADYLSK